MINARIIALHEYDAIKRQEDAMTVTTCYDDERIVTALRAWHEAERDRFERSYKNLVYDTHAPKRAVDGKRWVKLNNGDSGVYMVDKTSPDLCVYSIKSYGVPNKLLGSLDYMVTAWKDVVRSRP